MATLTPPDRHRGPGRPAPDGASATTRLEAAQRRDMALQPPPPKLGHKGFPRTSAAPALPAAASPARGTDLVGERTAALIAVTSPAPREQGRALRVPQTRMPSGKARCCPAGSRCCLCLGSTATGGSRQLFGTGPCLSAMAQVNWLTAHNRLSSQRNKSPPPIWVSEPQTKTELPCRCLLASAFFILGTAPPTTASSRDLTVPKTGPYTTNDLAFISNC